MSRRAHVTTVTWGVSADGLVDVDGVASSVDVDGVAGSVDAPDRIDEGPQAAAPKTTMTMGTPDWCLGTKG